MKNLSNTAFMDNEEFVKGLSKIVENGKILSELAYEIAEKAEVYLAESGPVFRYTISADNYHFELDDDYMIGLRKKIIRYLEEFKVNARVQRILEDRKYYTYDEISSIDDESCKAYTITIIRK